MKARADARLAMNHTLSANVKGADSTMIVCKQAIYSGRVQGVGFRYTTYRLASGLRVAGYVKNLSAGDVELVAEGETEEVGAFLQRVAQRMARYIQSTTVSEVPVQGFASFEIRH